MKGVDFKLTILFSSSSPKIPKSSIFGSKFWHFCFFSRSFAILRVVISNLTIVVFNSSPKIPTWGSFCQKYPNKAFGPEFRKFCFFAKFPSYTNLRVLISNMTILFSNSGPKIPKSGDFRHKFKDFYFLYQTLQ